MRDIRVKTRHSFMVLISINFILEKCLSEHFASFIRFQLSRIGRYSKNKFIFRITFYVIRDYICIFIVKITLRRIRVQTKLSEFTISFLSYSDHR